MTRSYCAFLALVVAILIVVPATHAQDLKVDRVLREIVLAAEYGKDAVTRTTVTERDGIIHLSTPDFGKAEEAIFHATVEGKKVRITVLPMWRPRLKDIISGHSHKFAANKTVLEGYKDAEYFLLEDTELSRKTSKDPLEWKKNLELYERHLGLDEIRGKASAVERSRRVAWAVSLWRTDTHRPNDRVVVGIEFTD